jgi:hypothetical protein
MEKKKQKPDMPGSLFEVFGWIQIAASPTITAVAIGYLIYTSNPTKTGLVLAIIISLAGFFLGAVWASAVHKKRGTIEFMSRVSASPELDQDKEKDTEAVNEKNGN